MRLASITEGGKKRTNGEKYMTLVFPLNSHDEPMGRARNQKLADLLRFSVYAMQGGWCYYCVPPQSADCEWHGALCLRTLRTMKPEPLMQFGRFQQLIERLREDALTPYVLLLDDDGGYVPELSVGISGNVPEDCRLPLDILVQPERGKDMNPAHVPFFALQGLMKWARKPLVEFSTEYDESYRRYFALLT